MEWFSNWWNGLELIEQVLYCIAIPSTLLLIVQAVLILVGAGVAEVDSGGLDGDLDSSSADASDFGVASLFTLQGVMSFLCVLGWSSLLMLGGGVHWVLALVIAFLLGFAVMYGMAKIIRYVAKLAHTGNLNVSNLLGSTGTVYLKIPPKGGGKGKVTVQTSERLVEFDAVNEGEASIPNNTQVRVVDILGGNILVVERE